MKNLENNKALFEFLGSLTQELTARGMKAQSEIVGRAMAFADGMSTEFLGESRVALQQLLRDASDRLTRQERAHVEQVIQEIDDAFDRRH